MIKVLKPGLYASIQDLGRYGFQDYGVPYSGAMDEYALKTANTLLGNHENDAVIEMTMIGMSLQFQCDTLICISGADMQPKINNKAVPTYKALQIKTHDKLSFGAVKKGFRTYLAVKGGIKSDLAMNSRSMYSRITKSYCLQKNDELPIQTHNNSALNLNAILKVNLEYFDQSELTVFKGPEFDLLSELQQQKLVSSAFTISNTNNRMAYLLEEPLENALKAIITSPVLPGTVQLTPSGKLIVLMKDCQVTGGYPRVLQLKHSSIAMLSQKRTGQQFSFNLV
ncbi:biotin-dependent carboxyltransferase family protein [Formosa undariae]|uniref:Biotin-dependent carboxyltransferase family protein n=1 Tax=Formosa undariae TaxID=1325436 RepID=A0ABV5F5Y7_9FLAO